MAQYEVVERSYIGERLVEPGTIIEHTPAPGTKVGSNLKPFKAAKPAGSEGDDK